MVEGDALRITQIKQGKDGPLLHLRCDNSAVNTSLAFALQ
jgi:hypothetical protein